MTLLTNDQRLQIVDTIHVFLGEPWNIMTLRGLIGLDLARRVRGSTSILVAEWVLDQALVHPDPTLFVKVVRAADTGQELVDIRAMADRLQAGVLSWTPPPAALWVPSEWPFVDRQDLRNTLDDMARGQGPPAITVEGPLGYGKRTMALYIKQLANAGAPFRPVLKELHPEPGPGLLYTMVGDLRDALGLGLPDDTTHQEPERSAAVFAQDLMLEGAGAAEPVWLVVNVIKVAGLEDGTIQFIDELLGHVEAVLPGPSPIRIVVMADGITRLGLKNLPQPSARHALPEIDRPALTEWLTAAVPGKQVQLYEFAADRVITRIAEQPEALRLDVLKRQCKEAHAMLLAVP